MAYLDYLGLAYFKSLLDENYLRTNYEGDTVINGNVTFTNPVDASVKNDWLGQQIDKTYIKDFRPEDDGEVTLVYGDNHEKVITIDTAVTQVRSDANEMYPILLCYDANAEVNQISKSVRYGHDVAINPAYGYVYANNYITKHPTYNRTISATSRAEWSSDFRDAVLNPMGQIFEYIDPVSQGGEHRMELRLYGNPNVAGINTPNVNYETNTVSLGVSATRGDALTFFGYAPSTPIYLEDGSTMRKSLVRGDQYGKDIITRDWLNLNGAITGLVHTYMDETIDGYKTFLKTVTIDSGDDNNKAGLNVQGNSHTHGNETVDGKLIVGGTAEISGGSGDTPSLKVNGNEIVTGKLTAEDLEATDDLTVGDDATIGGDLNVNGDENIKGKIYYVDNSNNKTEYVEHIVSQPEDRKKVAQGLADTDRAIGYDDNTGKLYVKVGRGITIPPTTGTDTDKGKIIANVKNDGGIVFDGNGAMYIDFSNASDSIKNAIVATLNMQIPLVQNKTFIVDGGHANATTIWRNPTTKVVDTTVGTENKPFKTIQSAVDCATEGYALGSHSITIKVKSYNNNNGGYLESVALPTFNYSTGHITIESYSGAKDVKVTPPENTNHTTGWCFSASGGVWIIKHIIMNKIIHNHSVSGHVSGCVQSSNGGTKLSLYGCDYILSSDNANGSIGSIRTIAADTDGRILLYADSLGSSIQTNKNYAIDVFALCGKRGGMISLWTSDLNAAGRTYTCSGSFTEFCHLDNSACVNWYGSADRLIFSGSSVTGKRYSLVTGSYCNTGSGSDTYFPGGGDDSAGTAQSSTGCWYY